MVSDNNRDVKTKITRTARAAPRAVGRPRTLSLDEILDEACALGLSDIKMPALAARLGTGTATLYNYVANREELVRLAVLRRARPPRLEDVGQDWRTLVRAHAKRFYDFFVSEPQVVFQYMEGALGPDATLEYIEAFLAAMGRRGFSASAAYRVFLAINTLVLGAVVRAAYLGAREQKGASQSGAIRRLLSEADPKAFPCIRACADFTDEASFYDFEEALELTLDSLSRRYLDGADTSGGPSASSE